MGQAVFKRASTGTSHPRIAVFMLDLSQTPPYPDGGFDFSVAPGGEPIAIVGFGMVVYEGTSIGNPIDVAIDPQSGKLRVFNSTNGGEQTPGADLSTYPLMPCLMIF